MRKYLMLLGLGLLIVNPLYGLSYNDNLRRDVLKRHQEVIGAKFDQSKFDSYKASLPKDGAFYVVEGDLLLNEAELSDYVIGKGETGTQEKPVLPNSELLVNLVNGKPDYYREIAKRKLTYAIDRNSFASQEQYDLVVKNVNLAGKEWADACSTCKVQYIYLKQFDASPSHEQVNFIVRLNDVQGRYIAASFFPNYDRLRRYLNIDPSYFTTDFDQVGVLRHELGHTLGYRHEHIRGIAGCYSEDNQWKPLTPYDPESVMHYFCGGAGSLMLRLTDTDKAGHRKLYR